jgi:hypothetical protein
MRAGQTEMRLRIVIEQPVVGVMHSLQSGDDRVLDPKASVTGAPLVFDFPVRVAPGPKFVGDQVRREGPTRRFVYVRIGQSAGDPASPWSRRMKVDIHDLEPALLAGAAAGGVIEIAVNGTGKDGTPACATARPVRRTLVAA